MRSTFICLLWSLFGSLVVPNRLMAQTASFNFTQYPVSVSGWVNIAGNPAAAVCSATDPSTGFTVSSIAAANWSPYTNGLSAYDSGGISGGTFFPAAVMLSHWFQYNNPATADYNGAIPQLKISGLQKDSVYTLRMTGSYGSYFDMDPTQYTVLGARPYGYIDINANNNTSTGAVFSHVSPDTTGSIYVYVNTVSTTQVADICGIQIITGSSGTYPAVSITNPLNNAGLSEDGTVTLTATASESGGSIARVEFYVDTTLLGAVTSPPYSVTWSGADPGPYTIIANAVDAGGNSNASAISVNVQSLNYYWSTTGNIGNDGDSNFVGNVDSVRLGFRTKNIERMTISPTGNIGIGTISPTAQLHVTGTVRLAGLTNDSTSADPRILVSDTLGNLSYRSAADLGLTAGSGLETTSTGILMLGDSAAGSGANNFTVNRHQNLNGYYYSIGGSVRDPVARPDFRWYDNGDIVAGVTMDTSVNTVDTPGVRYYHKLGVLEIGASDHLDTTRSSIVTDSSQGSGLYVNSLNDNVGNPQLINTVYLSYAAIMDTSVTLMNSLLPVAGLAIFSPGSLHNSLHVGGDASLSAPVSNSIIGGYEGIDVLTTASMVIGSNIQEDTTEYSTITGFENTFGAPGQLVAGGGLTNQTPFGAALGLNNVRFTSQSWTGTRGITSPGISGYPLLAIGNSAVLTDTQSTNALTVLYNGRTQINTVGYGVGLTQTQATPKAALEVVSTNTGVLFPQLTAAQQSAIATADLQTGLLLYNSDAGAYEFYTGSNWQPLGYAGDLSTEWRSLGNTGTSPASNFIGTTDAEPLVFRAHNTQSMTITTSGAVGIGTTSPQTSARLSVNGTIYAQKIEATQTGWADFVFEPGYHLIPLTALRRYIRQHQQLPGVISAGTAAANGVDLGDNQTVLLQKIEELTLYLIEAQKKAADRQAQIDRLKTANSRLDEAQRELETLQTQLEQLISEKK